MSLTDLTLIIKWWLVLFTLGLIFLPLSFRLTPLLKDKGYAVSKILSLGLISFILFVLGSFKFVPFTGLAVLLTCFLVAIINLIVLLKNKAVFLKSLKTILPLIAFEEIVFLIALSTWALIRGFNPEIQGLEKYMDFGFVNSLLKTKFFPPADMWLAGETVNYYYFGHLVTAVLIKLSHIKPVIAYNLMIASLFAFSFLASFSFGLNASFFLKIKKVRNGALLGLLTAFLLTLGGNLHPLFFALKEGSLKGYWYPDATRFIVQKFGALDNTIHEFPLYSFVVADLHGHLLNLPMVISFLLILLNLAISFKQTNKLILNWFQKASLALLLGIFFITNTWDFAIYTVVFSSVIFFLLATKNKLTISVLKTATFVLPLVALGLVLTIPFQLHFQNIASGVKLTDFHTPVWMLVVLWGLPLLLTLALLKSLFLKKKLFGADSFILGLIVPAWLFILLPEIIYVKDIYIQSYQRANTVFKFTYQSFVIFSLITPLLIGRILQINPRKTAKKIFLSITVVLIFFVSFYPFLAIKSFYQFKKYQGLAGDNYLKQYYPENLKIIEFLNKKTDSPIVIVEAVGESYTDYNQISSFTGLPTILGWRVHEWLWRGGFDLPAKKTLEVETIYQSTDLKETKNLLDQYQVNYVVIGSLERKKYSLLSEEKFATLGEIVFEENQTRLYQVR